MTDSAHAADDPGTLSATIKAIKEIKLPSDPPWRGRIEFEVTVKNDTSEDVFVENDPRMPYHEAATSPDSILTLRWDSGPWRDDLSSRPMGWQVPATLRLGAGASHTWQVWAENPVRLSNSDMVWWDETTVPPTMITKPPVVTLTAPITVKAIIGYNTRDFAFDSKDRHGLRNQFAAWQQALESDTTTLTAK